MTLPIEPISGTVYPIISGKPGITTFQNPPFHKNILNVGGANASTNPPAANAFNPGGTNLFRGVMVAGAGTPGVTKGNIQYRVNFLYNPATIYESRSLDLNNGVLPYSQRNPNDPGAYATGLNTTVEFSLLFDRTFELWDSSYQNTIAGTYGCRADVEAFYNLCGINELIPQTSTQVTVVAPPEVNTGRATNVVQGPMIWVPAYVYFGGTNSRGALNYYGAVSAFNVTWSHFTTEMIPARCEVDVTLTLMPNINSSSSSS
jgi:hypothetical protein